MPDEKPGLPKCLSCCGKMRRSSGPVQLQVSIEMVNFALMSRISLHY